MTNKLPKTIFVALTLILTLVVANFSHTYSEPLPNREIEAPPGRVIDPLNPIESQNGIVPPKWAINLPTKSCNGNNNCHLSSPAIADVNNDGRDDIILGTNNGHILVVRDNGQVIWDTDLSPYFGMAPNTQEIGSSPAVADIDGDGRMEIVVGTGTIRTNICTQGGVMVLNHNGNPEPGWPKLAEDRGIPPAGCRDTIFSSPALGDLDNDGDLEIVVGGFDKKIYAWHHTGQLLPGFAPDSWLRTKEPTWNDLKGRLADSIWGSPVIADLDNDGYDDIIISTDEGNYSIGWDDWDCPYRLPPGWAPGYCGGTVYALNRFGQVLPGFPIHLHEAIQSTPAIGDINNDGSLDIVVGTGAFYYNNSPDRPTNGFRVYAFNNRGQALPGWAGGKVTNGPVAASPSIGDISGDGRPEVVIAAMNERRLYAWNGSGQPVNGFPMTPVDHWGSTLATYDIGSSFILGDYDGDGKMEIFINQAWGVTIIDGNGQHITSTIFPGNNPIYLTNGSLLNTPAVGDIDNDGRLELITHNSQLFVWDLDSSSDLADWPMFKRDAAGEGRMPLPPNLAAPTSFALVRQQGVGGRAEGTFHLNNVGAGDIDWTITGPSGVRVTPSSGTLLDGSVIIDISRGTGGYGRGVHFLGNLTITGTIDGVPVPSSPLTVPLTLVIGDLYFQPIHLR